MMPYTYDPVTKQTYWQPIPLEHSPCFAHIERQRREETAFRSAWGAFIGDLAYPPNRSAQIGPPQRFANLPEPRR